MYFYDYIDWISLVSSDETAGWPKSVEIRRRHAADIDPPLGVELAELCLKVTGLPLPQSSPRRPNGNMPGFSIVEKLLKETTAPHLHQIGVAINEMGVVSVSIAVSKAPSGSSEAAAIQDQVDNVAMIVVHMVKRMLGVDVRSRNRRVDPKVRTSEMYMLGPGDLKPVPIWARSRSALPDETAGKRAEGLLDLQRLAKLETGGRDTSAIGARPKALSTLTSRSIGLRDQLMAAIDMHRDSFRHARPIQWLSAELAMTIAALCGMFLGVVFSETLVHEFGRSSPLGIRLEHIFFVAALLPLLGYIALGFGRQALTWVTTLFFRESVESNPFRPVLRETEADFRRLRINLLLFLLVVAVPVLLNWVRLNAANVPGFETLAAHPEHAFWAVVVVAGVALLTVAVWLSRILAAVAFLTVLVGWMYAAFVRSEAYFVEIETGLKAQALEQMAHLGGVTILVFGTIWLFTNTLWTTILRPVGQHVADTQRTRRRSGAAPWLVAILFIAIALGASAPRLLGQMTTFSQLENLRADLRCSHDVIVVWAEKYNEPLAPATTAATKDTDAQDKAKAEWAANKRSFDENCQPVAPTAGTPLPWQKQHEDTLPAALDKPEAGIMALALIVMSTLIYVVCLQYQSRSEDIQRLAAQWADDGVDYGDADQKLHHARVRLRLLLSMVPATMLTLGCILYAFPMALPGDGSVVADQSGSTSVVYRKILEDIGWALPVLAFGILAQVWNQFGVSGATTLIHDVTIARLTALQALIKSDNTFVERLNKRIGTKTAAGVSPASLYVPDLEREAALLDPKVDLITKLKEIVSGAFVRRSAIVGAVVLAVLQIQPLKSLQPDKTPTKTKEQIVAERFLKCLDEKGGSVQKCFAGSGDGRGGLVELTINGKPVEAAQQGGGKQVYTLNVGVEAADPKAAKQIDLGQISVQSEAVAMPSTVRIIDKTAPEGRLLTSPGGAGGSQTAHTVDVVVAAEPTLINLKGTDAIHEVALDKDNAATVQIVAKTPKIDLVNLADSEDVTPIAVKDNTATISVAPARVSIINAPGDTGNEPVLMALDQGKTTIMLQPNRVDFAAVDPGNIAETAPKDTVSIAVEKFGDSVVARLPLPPTPDVNLKIATPDGSDARAVGETGAAVKSGDTITLALRRDPLQIEVAGAALSEPNDAAVPVVAPPNTTVRLEVTPPELPAPEVTVLLETAKDEDGQIEGAGQTIVDDEGVVKVKLNRPPLNVRLEGIAPAPGQDDVVAAGDTVTLQVAPAKVKVMADGAALEAVESDTATVIALNVKAKEPSVNLTIAGAEGIEGRVDGKLAHQDTVTLTTAVEAKTTARLEVQADGKIEAFEREDDVTASLKTSATAAAPTIIEVRGPGNEDTADVIERDGESVATIAVDAHVPELRLVDTRKNAGVVKPGLGQTALPGRRVKIASTEDYTNVSRHDLQRDDIEAPFTIAVPTIDLLVLGATLEEQIDIVKNNPSQVILSMLSQTLPRDRAHNPMIDGIPSQCSSVGRFYFYRGTDKEGGLVCYKSDISNKVVIFRKPDDIISTGGAKITVLKENYPEACEPHIGQNRADARTFIRNLRKANVPVEQASGGTNAEAPKERFEFVAVGYTDSTGRLQRNIEISTTRAKAIGGLLRRSNTVDVSALGRGEEILAPLIPGGLQNTLDSPMSRRVDLYTCSWPAGMQNVAPQSQR